MSFLDSFFIYKKFIPLFKENDKPTLKKDRFVINLNPLCKIVDFLLSEACYTLFSYLKIFIRFSTSPCSAGSGCAVGLPKGI